MRFVGSYALFQGGHAQDGFAAVCGRSTNALFPGVFDEDVDAVMAPCLPQDTFT